MCRWETEEEEARRLFPGDFIFEDEEEWCFHCDSHNCRCHEREEEYKLLGQEWEMKHLYHEALEEDQERDMVAEQEAQQAEWGAEIGKWERLEAETQTWLEEYLKDHPRTWRGMLESWWQKIKYQLWH